MKHHLVDFNHMEWVDSGTGVRVKKVVHENQQMRIVEFSEGFVEPDWCQHGHAGYVLDGEFALDFNGTIERYKKDDVVLIPNGENDKHKAVLGKGEKVTLLLFEIV